MEDFVEAYVTYELGKMIPRTEYEKLPKIPDYETALKVIRQIQNVMNTPDYDYKFVYDRIGYILGDNNIFYPYEK
ncbi:MAG: hypothetical protein E7404_06420 [Ruminococcaceae bacterium]|nr:hypothetical protein [Oscillospiraceae bacterium]